ncbi:MAG: CDP-alcohol phosphatidyltransferase family protein [Candidatus Latescibacteria bacterium]|nr:CDP-alcohol phosphatidyltransferase family protein [Candidatus Latescibacterota bacterium]MCK5733120.1 CDP-alcohol phosphatidyltransferase family protein [Candidatus Latescibacterota bacterium]
MIERYKEDFVGIVKPLTRLFVKNGWHPDLLTILGLLGNMVAAMLFAVGSFFSAGLCVLLAGLLDVLDGEVARMGHKSSTFGALLDSTLDRYSEIFVAFGITVFFVRSGWVMTSVILFFALAGSLMVSYVRARAEGLGETCKVGFMQRPERVLAIAAGGIIGVEALAVVMWIIAFLTHFTVAERLWHVWKKTRGLELEQEE